MKLKFFLKRIHVTQSYSNKNCKPYVLDARPGTVYRFLDVQYNLQPLNEIFSPLKLKKL